jgi:hypothetical protein
VRAAWVAFSLVAACSFGPQKSEKASLRPAFDSLLVGQSGKAEARAALGEATVIDFDSGYEVWVYREQLEDAPPREYVLLFPPSGVLAKKRQK